MEAKMTPEQKAQSLAMMKQMQARMSQGGSATPGGQPGPQGQGRPQGQPQGQGQGQPQGGQARQGGAPGAGFGGQRDPQAVAEQLRTSLQGIRESADFLLKADYVK